MSRRVFEGIQLSMILLGTVGGLIFLGAIGAYECESMELVACVRFSVAGFLMLGVSFTVNYVAKGLYLRARQARLRRMQSECLREQLNELQQRKAKVFNLHNVA